MNRIQLVLAALALCMPWGARAQESGGLQHVRPHDKGGINVFEPPKKPGAPFEGLRVQWSAQMTQQFQNLRHENAAEPRIVDGVNVNHLVEIGAGLNRATANLDLGVQLAQGIRLHLTTFLSTRRHPETWVKDGYLLVDRVPMIESEALDRIMQYLTVRVGHFEINYGDQHFRRTDNGAAIYNPFVGNTILDAYTTEIGGEVYFRTPSGFLAMAAVTGGEIQGTVLRPDDRAPSFYGKLGFDREINESVRVRLTGSVYTTAKSLNNTLYDGDRAGSRYYFVMENADASVTSGRVNPGFRNEVTAFMVNPFLKVRGLELFGLLERAEGAAANQAATRTVHHYMGEAVYRFHREESLYFGVRYGKVSGEILPGEPDVSVGRVQLSGGWFLTPQILLKGEYVRQEYSDLPVSDIRHEGKFSGMVLEGVVAF